MSLSIQNYDRIVTHDHLPEIVRWKFLVAAWEKNNELVQAIRLQSYRIPRP